MKRDLHIWKETYIYEKRPTYMKRDLQIWKETYIYEKRPVYRHSIYTSGSRAVNETSTNLYRGLHGHTYICVWFVHYSGRASHWWALYLGFLCSDMEWGSYCVVRALLIYIVWRAYSVTWNDSFHVTPCTVNELSTNLYIESFHVTLYSVNEWHTNVYIANHTHMYEPHSMSHSLYYIQSHAMSRYTQ